MDLIMQVAIDVARQGLAEGCIPIGSSSSSAMVSSSGGGHNRRVQEDNPVLHAEIGCLRNAGRIGSYRNTALCSTLMPCYLCAGAVVPFGIPGVVCGESRTFPGA